MDYHRAGWVHDDHVKAAAKLDAAHCGTLPDARPGPVERQLASLGPGRTNDTHRWVVLQSNLGCSARYSVRVIDSSAKVVLEWSCCQRDDP